MRRLDLCFLGDGQSCKRGFDAGTRFGDALLEVRTGSHGDTKPTFQGAVFLRQAAGDFDQARYTFAQHLEIIVHVAGW